MQTNEMTVTYNGRDIDRALFYIKLILRYKAEVKREHRHSNYSKQSRREIKKLETRLQALITK
jgi:uncharacterized protein YprB with RNaseH-like and TPR domain